MPDDEDEEVTTDPRIAVFDASELEHAPRGETVHFRCTECLGSVIVEDCGTRAPLCVACRRYMAPVNEQRGQA